MSEYAALLTELTALPALAKSEAAAPVDAAPEAVVVEEPKAAEPTVVEDEPKAEAVAEVEGEVVAKSEIPEGFIDATEIVDGLRADLAAARAEMAEMGKVVTMAAGLAKSLHAAAHDQGEVIKSLQADIVRLGNTGAGRRAVLVAPKPAPARPDVTSDDVMTKALAAQQAGRITGRDVSLIVAHATRGMSVPEHLARQIGAI